jgi:TonB family protein
MASDAKTLTTATTDHTHLRWAGAAAFGLHLSLVLTVALLAWFFQVKSLRQLMAEGGSIAQSGPAPVEEMEVVLLPEQTPPPPTVNPDFVREIVKPKPVPVPPVIKPKVMVPKPTPQPKPKYTAVGATGNGESAGASRLVVGSSSFPHPDYPFTAKEMHQTGTVMVRIQFDSAGQASDVEIESSSGFNTLDNSTRSFILANWHDPHFAGRSCSVPVEYRLDPSQ